MRSFRTVSLLVAFIGISIVTKQCPASFDELTKSMKDDEESLYSILAEFTKHTPSNLQFFKMGSEERTIINCQSGITFIVLGESYGPSNNSSLSAKQYPIQAAGNHPRSHSTPALGVVQHSLATTGKQPLTTSAPIAPKTATFLEIARSYLTPFKNNK